MDLDKNKDARLFDFVITSSVPDKEGDVVPEDEIEEALDGWLRRGAPMSDEHTNRIIGKGLRWWEADGQYIGRGEIYKDSKVADEVWNKIKGGTYKSVSIGGGAFDKTPNESGGNNLNELEILEVAVCESGMHQDSNILDSNTLAKNATPFFMKADIKPVEVKKPGEKTHSEKWDRCVAHVKANNPSVNAYAVCTAALGEESFSKKEDKDFTKKLKLEVKNMVKKEDGNYVSQEQFAELAAKVQEIASMLEAKPAEDVVEEQEEEEKPKEKKPEEEKQEEEKPKKKPEEEMEKEGGIGVKEVTPSPEGGEVTLPATVDEERKEVGEEPTSEDVPADKVPLTEKTEVKKARKSVMKSTTPLPRAERIESVKKEIPSWEIIKGTKTIGDFERDTTTERLEAKVAQRKAFEQEYKLLKGGN